MVTALLLNAKCNIAWRKSKKQIQACCPALYNVHFIKDDRVISINLTISFLSKFFYEEDIYKVSKQKITVQAQLISKT